jgi:hypothetical protein
MAEERLDDLLVAFEQMPLAERLAADQSSARQGRQVREHG